MKKTGAEILWEGLIREGVNTVFGIPGVATMPVYDAMLKYPIHHVLVRHEQGAAHMADGYARASGKVGVAIATSGPGATNLVTGLAAAMLDSSPIVCITGQVISRLLGGDAFQEVDVGGITMPITKHNFLVTCADEIAQVVHDAFTIARSGRPGPVLIDFCKDAQLQESKYISSRGSSYNQTQDSCPKNELYKAVELIAGAKHPIILAGHGVLISGAGEQLRRLAERTQTPVAMTLLGLGGFPASHPLSLGMMGMHGQPFCNLAVQNSDLVLALGMRFDDRATGDPHAFAPNARKIQIDIDPSEFNKNIRVDLTLQGDLRPVLEYLLPLVQETSHADWLARIESWREEVRLGDKVARLSKETLSSISIIRKIRENAHAEAIIVTDVGQNQMWTAQHYGFEKPGSLITSGGVGCMGFGLPAAIGAWFAQQNREIWVITGDGGFQMTQAELATTVQEKANVKIVILNNTFLGLVRQAQELLCQRRYSAVKLINPDFVRLAGVYNIPARHIERCDDISPALEFARRTPGPVLLEFDVEKEEGVYPYVPPGADLGAMIRSRKP